MNWRGEKLEESLEKPKRDENLQKGYGNGKRRSTSEAFQRRHQLDLRAGEGRRVKDNTRPNKGLAAG